LQSVVVSVRRLISDTSTRLLEQIDSNLSQNKRLHAEMLEWAERQGLGRKEDRIRLISRQAIYHLILKLMLYELVRQRFSLPEASIDSLKDLHQLFETAYEATRIEAFASSFLDRIIQGCDGKLSDEISHVAELVENVEENRADFIGRVYEDIIPGEERRKLGEFYTPRDVAEFMIGWAIQTGNERVLDPACGSGTFLVESFYRLAELGCSPNDAVRSLHGIDVNPLAVLMSTVNLVARVQESKPNLSVLDFLRVTSWKEEQKFQAIVCNPPYSRHHELSQDYKELIARTMDAECGGKISRLSSIYVHFLIHATGFLDDGGRMAFITPSEFLDVDYGVELKRFLLEGFTLRAIILFPEESLVFPKALTRACITLLERKRPIAGHNVIFIRLDRSPEPEDLLKVIRSGGRGGVSWGAIDLIPQSHLTPEGKWSYKATKTREISGFIPLRGVAQAHRGIATGANDFFTLSEGEVSRYGIERGFLKPIITNARRIPHYDFTKTDFQRLARAGNKVWLLSCDRPMEELRKHPGLMRYLALGKERGIHKRYLTQAREVWYFQERKQVAPIVFTYMSRKNPRFVYNKAEALTLNTLHTIHPVEAIAKDKVKLKALLCYLNSGVCADLLRRTGRVYGGGLVKLEPREVESLSAIDLEKLSNEEIALLGKLFDELCRSSREGRDGETKKRIDEVLARITER